MNDFYRLRKAINVFYRLKGNALLLPTERQRMAHAFISIDKGFSRLKKQRVLSRDQGRQLLLSIK